MERMKAPVGKPEDRHRSFKFWIFLIKDFYNKGFLAKIFILLSVYR
jgi:hypothetical protein